MYFDIMRDSGFKRNKKDISINESLYWDKDSLPMSFASLKILLENNNQINLRGRIRLKLNATIAILLKSKGPERAFYVFELIKKGEGK